MKEQTLHHGAVVLIVVKERYEAVFTCAYTIRGLMPALGKDDDCCQGALKKY